jgi:hypothetical protein
MGLDCEGIARWWVRHLARLKGLKSYFPPGALPNEGRNQSSCGLAKNSERSLGQIMLVTTQDPPGPNRENPIFV